MVTATSGSGDMNPFMNMLRDVLGDRLADASTFLDMLADDIEVAHPYADPEAQKILGKAAMLSHVTATKQVFDIRRSDVKNIVYASDGTQTVIEFELEGRWLQAEGGYVQCCVAFIETRNGRITRMKEYWNPVAPGMPRSSVKVP